MNKMPIYIGLASTLFFSSAGFSHGYANNSEQTTTQIQATFDSSEVIAIPDSYLKEAIAHALHISPNSNITSEQLQSLTSLNAGYVTSLEGLQHATNLKELVLYEGKVADLSPLANLTGLEKLDASSNQISNLSPLKNLTNLTHLYLGGNTITAISPLANLTKLEELHISDNQISNLSPLSKLTHLRYLYLEGNKITYISYLSNLTNLEVLALGNNNISNISYLSKLENLYYLSLYQNNISRISYLSNLTSLEELYLSDNRILTFSPVRALENLIYLEQSNNPGEDTVKPKIKGVENKTIVVNEKFSATLGVTATDNKDGDITEYLEIEGTVDTQTVGSYDVTYIVEDSVGNQTEVNRTITVKKDTVKPTISGIENKTVKKNKIFYLKAGVTAKDNIDGNITKNIKVTGTVNEKKAGKYTLYYTVTDTSGNTTKKKRVITVE